VLRPFTLHRPETAEEACALLAELGEDAAAYAGGTELLLLMKLDLLRLRHLVDVKRIPRFGEIGPGPRATSGARLTIGAAVTHRAVERSPLVGARCPLVASVARHVANVRVRNVGTVGGNLAFADPHSDLATLFLTLDASVELVSPRGRRELPLGDFVRGPWETARAADELLASVTLTPWGGDTAAAYVKFGVYERPTLAVAAALRLDGTAGAQRSGDRIVDARLAIGCVGPTPVRLADVVIGVLPQKQHLHFVVWRIFQSIEDVFLRWEDGVIAPLLRDELLQLLEVRLVELRRQHVAPALRDALQVHRGISTG